MNTIEEALKFKCKCGNEFMRSPYYDDWTCPVCRVTYELDIPDDAKEIIQGIRDVNVVADEEVKDE